MNLDCLPFIINFIFLSHIFLHVEIYGIRRDLLCLLRYMLFSILTFVRLNNESLLGKIISSVFIELFPLYDYSTLNDSSKKDEVLSWLPFLSTCLKHKSALK